MLEGHEYDNRWTVKDKIRQYRGLLALCERDKEKLNKDYDHDKDQSGQKLNDLKREVRLLRLQLNDICNGEILRPFLQNDRRFLLALQNKSPFDMINDLHQRNCTKVKEINKLQYVKNLKMEELEKALVEIEEIKKRQGTGFSLQTDLQKKQILTKEIQNTIVRHDAAKCVNNTYRRMADLMKEDALYMDHIFSTLSRDADEQSRCITNIKAKGETAALENEKIRSELHNLEEKTVIMIRIRDRAIRQLRQQIRILSTRLKTIGSEESDDHNKGFTLEMLTQQRLSEEDETTPLTLKNLEKGVKELQEVTMVTDYKNIFYRLQDQLEQGERLIMQVKVCEQKRESYYDMRSYIRLSLESIIHTQSEECKRHVEDERMLRDRLQEEKSRKEKSNQLVEDLTKKLLDMRAIIITLHEIVGRVKTPDEVSEITEIENEMTFKEIISQIDDPFETLELIKEKVRKLRHEVGLALENWPVQEVKEAENLETEETVKQTPEVKALVERDPMIVDVAKKEYHNRVIEHISRGHFGGTVAYLYNLEEDDEIEVGVITRADIKTASRRIVKESELPLFGLSSKKGARNLHKAKKPRRRKWTLMVS